jgi:hypothetical protein
MSKFWKEVKKEKVSFIGILVSIGLFVFSYFVPYSVPLPVSQSIFDSLMNSSAGSGALGLEPVIALSTIAVVLFSVFLVVGVVRVWRRR